MIEFQGESKDVRPFLKDMAAIRIKVCSERLVDLLKEKDSVPLEMLETIARQLLAITNILEREVEIYKQVQKWKEDQHA